MPDTLDKIEACAMGPVTAESSAVPGFEPRCGEKHSPHREVRLAPHRALEKLGFPVGVLFEGDEMDVEPDGGWLKCYRISMSEDDRFWGKKPFHPWMARWDLIQLAAWKDTKRVSGNTVFTQLRGQVLVSERMLVKRWKWSNQRVRAFIDVLQKLGTIVVEKPTQETKHLGTFITITNYERYQRNYRDDQSTNQSDNAAGIKAGLQQVSKQEEEVKEVKERKNTDPPADAVGGEGKTENGNGKANGKTKPSKPNAIDPTKHLHPEIIKIWETLYAERRGIPWDWRTGTNGRDQKALQAIRQKYEGNLTCITALFDYAMSEAFWKSERYWKPEILSPHWVWENLKLIRERRIEQEQAA